MKLQGAVAIVTGSSSVTGIGAETAKGLAARGAKVVVNYATNEAGAEETAEACAAPGGGAHAAGATREERGGAVETAADAGALRGLYTIVGRSEVGFVPIPYHEAFAEPTRRAASKLREAARRAEGPGRATRPGPRPGGRPPPVE